jgi:hypothetical protein
MKTIKEHVEEWFLDVPESEKKETVKQEIIQNLEEKMFDLMAQGKLQEDAINKTIVEFGDIEEIKRELGASQPKQKDNAKLNLGFSIWGSILIIAMSVFINLYYSPQTIWFVYPTFVVLWWPLSMFYYWLRKR